MRFAVLAIIGLLFGSSPAFAVCGSDTPPATAAALGLTQESFCDDFTNTNSIDVADTRNPTACPSATFPSGICHWYTHRQWPKSTLTNCGVNGTPGNLCNTTYPPTLAADYSTTASGLQLTPRRATTTGNNTNGTSTITGISVVSGTLPTTGTIIVYGPGIPINTRATISGTTASLLDAAGSPQNTTSGSTGGTYFFGVVYNGWMLQSAAAVTASPGYVGNVFIAPFYVEASATFSRSAPDNAQWTGIESYPEFWMLPTEFQNAAFSAPVTSNVHFCEIDAFDLVSTHIGARNFIGETINGDGNLYFAFNQAPGVTDYIAQSVPGGGSTPVGTGPYGILVTSPGQFASTGKVQIDEAGSAVLTSTFSASTVPTLTGVSTVFSPGTPVSGYFSNCAGEHWMLQLAATPNWTMTDISVRVWTLPQQGGRTGMFR